LFLSHTSLSELWDKIKTKSNAWAEAEIYYAFSIQDVVNGGVAMSGIYKDLNCVNVGVGVSVGVGVVVGVSMELPCVVSK
jgi:hypothetical protein